MRPSFNNLSPKKGTTHGLLPEANMGEASLVKANSCRSRISNQMPENLNERKSAW